MLLLYDKERPESIKKDFCETTFTQLTSNKFYKPITGAFERLQEI
jgi:hypothetical protein